MVIYHVHWVEKGGDSKLLFSQSENELAVAGEGEGFKRRRGYYCIRENEVTVPGEGQMNQLGVKLDQTNVHNLGRKYDEGAHYKFCKVKNLDIS